MKLLICGDVVATDISRDVFANADEKTAFGNVLDNFKSADRVMVNLECAVTDSEEGIMKVGPCLKAPLNTVETLKKAGVTDICLSNNHIFDFGKKGFYDTISAIEKAGLNYTGVGENYEDSRKNQIITDGNMKIAIVNVCEHEYSYALDDRCGTRPFDEFETMHDIRKAKAENDYVIVIYHGGKEICRYPSPRLLRACREMVRCGADAIFCQHSHIIGCYEEFEGGHILYGQGNFHFVWNNMGESWKEGLMASLDITNEGINVKYIPVVVDGAGIKLADEKKATEILEDLQKRNEELLNGEWKKGWREFCESKREWYNGVRLGEKVEEPGDITQMFAHYLDCEAHRDVWMELFPTWNKSN